MSMFMGEFNHTIDAKGRLMPVCVPTKRMGKLSRKAKNFATY